MKGRTARGAILCGAAVKGEQLAAAENIKLAAEAGIERLEPLVSGRRFPFNDVEAAGGAAAAMARWGVACRSVHLDFELDYDISSSDESIRRSTVDDMKRALAAGRALGADIAVLHGSDEAVAAHTRARRIEILKSSLAELCSAARASGIRLALELLPRDCLANTTREALFITGGLPEETIGFCFDVNHVNLREDPPLAVEALSGRIFTFHISDNDGVEERHWFPFEGVIDWAAFMAAVRRIGYAGQFIFETGGSLGGDAAEYLREVRARFDRLIAL